MENNEETTQERRHYKIEVGRVYTIKRNDVEYNGKTIVNYSIGFPKKKSGHTKFLYKRVYFKSPTNLKNNTKILINDMYEDAIENKRDNYNPIWYIVILDYEIIEEPSDTTDALINYQNDIFNAKIEQEEENDDLITF